MAGPTSAEGHPGRSPLGVVATLDADTISAAVKLVTSRAGQRRQLAWALQDRPELLGGAGAQSPVPSVLRLIDVLCEAGATKMIRPACPHCGRVVKLSELPPVELSLFTIRGCREILSGALVVRVFG
jgi:hypothetical protein